MPTFAPPSGDLPAWLQQGNTGQLQSLLGQLPQLFNTKGLNTSYQNAISGEMNQGRALAAAGSRQYANRAAQTGASGLGAGFAAGQALLPYFDQRNSMLSDLEKQKLLARTQQAQLSGDLAGRIGQLQQMRQGMISDYSTAQQKLQQESTQFDTTNTERQREFNTTSGQQQQGLNLDALKLAMQVPRQHYQWNEDQFGKPEGPGAADAKQGYQNQQNYWGQIQQKLGFNAPRPGPQFQGTGPFF